MGNKKTRHIKNIGSVYFDNTKNVWVGQVEDGKYESGRTKYKRFLGSSQEDVIYRMKEFKKKLCVLIDPDKACLLNFGEFFESFLENVKKPQIKIASYTRNVYTWNGNIKPYLAGYYITDLTTQLIQNEMINKLIIKQCAYSTIHKAYVLLNESLKYAVKQGIIQNNPCSMVEMPKKSKSVIKDIRFFDDDEIERFKTVALDESWKKTDFHNGLFIVSLIYTGLRAGEATTLKWKDINFEDKFIKVRTNVAIAYDDDHNRQVIEQDSTKTRKSRVVYLTQSAQDYLEQLYEIRKPQPDDYVFMTRGSRDISALETLYLQTCRRAKIDNQQGLHTLRHTFASLMIRKGVDIKLISEMLGHSSVSFTYNTYVHLIEEEKAKIITQIQV